MYGIFITLLVGVAVLLLVSLVPITGNVEIKIVKSGSMAPAIETGSLVVVVPRTRYAVGDVITFGKDTRDKIPTTHRVVAVREQAGQMYYATKGDANEEQDPAETAARDVIGQVLFHVPYAGYILDFARQPTGFALLIGLPAMMIVFDESATILKEVVALRRRRKNTPSRLNLDYQGSTSLDSLEVPQKPQVFRTRIPTI
jgi:signal peptidase